MKNDDITFGERKLLSSIKALPGIYIGSKNLSNLEHFIHGYDTAMLFLGINDKHVIIPEGMQEYVESKYNVSHYTTKSYFSIMAENSDDEEQAFELFFDVLDEYLLSIDREVLPAWNDAKDSIKQIKALLSLSSG